MLGKSGFIWLHLAYLNWFICIEALTRSFILITEVKSTSANLCTTYKNSPNHSTGILKDSKAEERGGESLERSGTGLPDVEVYG
jgi:hypothetical protein